MKRSMIMPVIPAVLLFGADFSFKKNPPVDESVTLQDAEKQTIVKSTVISNGDYTGDCIDLTLSNQKPKTVKIKIPAGTVFIADDAGEQNILVATDIYCSLKPGESKSFDISGYCCEKSDSAPDDGATFKTSMHTDEKVKKLTDFLKGKNYPDHSTQEAIWCVANGSSASNIYCEDPAQQKELMKFVCDLTGQKETWYTSRQNHQVDEQRRIVSQPVEVKGMLSCDIDKPTYVSNEVYDSENNLLYTMGEPMLFPRKGHYEYEFDLTVEGWEKGKYYVLVKGGNKQLLKQEFEI